MSLTAPLTPPESPLVFKKPLDEQAEPEPLLPMLPVSVPAAKPSFHYEWYQFRFAEAAASTPQISFLTSASLPTTIQEWRAMKNPFYIMRSGYSTAQIPRISREHDVHIRISIIQAETLPIPVEYLPGKPIPAEYTSFHITARPGFLDPILHAHTRLDVEYVHPKQMPAECKEYYAFRALHQPAFAIRQNSSLDIVNVTYGTRLYPRDPDDEGPQGWYRIRGTLGYTQDNSKEILKLRSETAGAAFRYIYLLVDPSTIHPSVALEVNSNAPYAENFLLKWRQWNERVGDDEKEEDRRFHSILGSYLQVIQHRRRSG